MSADRNDRVRKKKSRVIESSDSDSSLELPARRKKPRRVLSDESSSQDGSQSPVLRTRQRRHKTPRVVSDQDSSSGSHGHRTSMRLEIVVGNSSSETSDGDNSEESDDSYEEEEEEYSGSDYSAWQSDWVSHSEDEDWAARLAAPSPASTPAPATRHYSTQGASSRTRSRVATAATMAVASVTTASTTTTRLLSSDSDSDGQSEKCPICLRGFSNQEIGTPESCDHSFCSDCLQEWAKNVNTCPVDRQMFTLILVRKRLNGKVVRQIPVEERQLQVDYDEPEEDPTYCEICGHNDREDRLLLCDGCDLGYHLECLDPPLEQVPIEQWFCPDCIAAGNTSLGEENLGEEMFRLLEELDEYESQRQSRTQPERRLMPRTRQNVRVSGRVRTRQLQRQAEQPSTSSGLESQDVETAARRRGTRTAPVRTTRARITRKKRRKKKCRTKARKMRKVTVVNSEGEEEEVEVPYSTKTKRRKKRRKKTKKTKKVVVRSRRARTARVVVPLSTRTRIAEHLRMLAPQRPGQTIPDVRPQRTPAPVLRGLGFQRSRAGIPTLHIFGQRDQLDYFSGSDQEDGGGVCVVSRPRTSALRHINRKIAPISPLATPCDLVSSILDSQSVWHSKKAEVTIKRDGTLEVRNKSEQAGKERVDINDPSHSQKITSRAPMYSGRSSSGSGDSRQPPESSGLHGSASLHAYHGGRGFSSITGFDARSSRAGYSSFLSTSQQPPPPPPLMLRGGPLRFRMNSPRFPVRSLRPPPLPPRLLHQQIAPTIVESFDMDDDVRSREEDDEIDLYSDIEVGASAPADEEPEKSYEALPPPPIPPAMLMDFGEQPLSDDDERGSDAELVIDDNGPAQAEIPDSEIYDPASPSRDTDEETESVEPVDIPLPPTKRLVQYSPDSSPPYEIGTYPALTEKLTMAATAIGLQSARNSSEEEEMAECPNFSIYSAASMDLARATDDLDRVPQKHESKPHNTAESEDETMPTDLLKETESVEIYSPGSHSAKSIVEFDEANDQNTHDQFTDDENTDTVKRIKDISEAPESLTVGPEDSSVESQDISHDIDKQSRSQDLHHRELQKEESDDDDVVPNVNFQKKVVVTEGSQNNAMITEEIRDNISVTEEHEQYKVGPSEDSQDKISPSEDSQNNIMSTEDLEDKLSGDLHTVIEAAQDKVLATEDLQHEVITSEDSQDDMSAENLQDKVISADYSQDKVILTEEMQSRVIQNEDSQDRVMPNEDSQDRVMPNEDSQGRVMPNEDSQDRVIPNEDSQDRVMPNEDSQDRVMPNEESQDRVMPNEESQDRVIPNEDSQDRVIPNEDSQDRVMPNEDSQDIVMPNEDSQDRVMPNEDSQDRVMPNEDSQDRVMPNEDSHDRVMPNEDSQDRVMPNEDRVMPNEDSQDRAMPSEDSHDKVMTTEDSHDEVIATEDFQGKVMATEDSQDKVMFAEDSEEKVIATEESQDKVMLAEDSEEKGIATEESQDKVFATDFQDKFVENEDSQDKVVASEELKEKVIGSDDSQVKAMATDDSQDRFFTNEDSQDKVITVEDSPYSVTCEDLQESGEFKELAKQSENKNLLYEEDSQGKVLSTDNLMDIQLAPRDLGLDNLSLNLAQSVPKPLATQKFDVKRVNDEDIVAVNKKHIRKENVSSPQGNLESENFEKDDETNINRENVEKRVCLDELVSSRKDDRSSCGIGTVALSRRARSSERDKSDSSMQQSSASDVFSFMERESLVAGAARLVFSATPENIPPPGLEGLETETISETEEAINFDDTISTEEVVYHEDGDVSSYKKRKKKKNRKTTEFFNERQNSRKDLAPIDYEEGEIVDDVQKKDKRSADKKEKHDAQKVIVADDFDIPVGKLVVEEEKKKKKKKSTVDKKGQSKERVVLSSTENKDKSKDRGVSKEDENISWKKPSKSTKDRNYRDPKGNEPSPKGREPSKKDIENKDKKRKKEKRKDMERYDVRKVVGDKKRKKRDEFGRDLPSRDRSYSRSRSRGRSYERLRNRSRSISRGRGRSPVRTRTIWSMSRSRSRSRNRSRNRSRSRSRNKAKQRSRRSRSRDKQRGRQSRDRSKSRGKHSRSKSRSRSINRLRARSRSRTPARPREKKARSREQNVSTRRNRTLRDRRSWSHTWTPSWSRSRSHSYSSSYSSFSRSQTPSVRHANRSYSRSFSRSWSRERHERIPMINKRVDTITKSAKKLTVIVPNTKDDTDRQRKKEKKRKDKKVKESVPEKRKKRKEKSPAPSKEVFTSGDNILVSVNFSKTNKTGMNKSLVGSGVGVSVLPTATGKELGKRKHDGTFEGEAVKRKKEKLAKDKAAKGAVVAGEKPVSEKKRKKLTKPSPRIAAVMNKKPVAIIDLDQSPFHEQTPSPTDLIVLSDSDENLDKELPHASPSPGEKERAPTPPISVLHTPDSRSPVMNYLVTSTGPKTPPEPHIKFSLAPLKPQMRTVSSNPLREEEMLDEEAAMDQHLDDAEEVVHKGPNTPPEPRGPSTPRSPPISPDAYDPFDPTKSGTPSPVGMEISMDDEEPSPEGTLSEVLPTVSSVVVSSPPLLGDPEELPGKSTDVGSLLAAAQEVCEEPSLSPAAPVVTVPKSPPLLCEPISTTVTVEPEVAPVQTLDEEPVVVVSEVSVSPQQQKAAATPVKTQQHSQPQGQLFSAPKQGPQATSTPSVLPLPGFPSLTPSSIISLLTTTPVGRQPFPLLPQPARHNGETKPDDEIDLDLDSPYSPASSEGDDLFEPPPETSRPSVRTSSKSLTKLPLPVLPRKSHDKFDSLFGVSPLRSKAASRSVRQAKPFTKAPKAKLKSSGKKEIAIKMDEDQLQILDELPSSAVEMQVKDKFLKKLNRQERVVEEVKMSLKPHYTKKHITKEEYKDILRRSVPKICHNKSGEINPVKIALLVEAYVKKYRYHKKKNTTGVVSSAAKTKLSHWLRSLSRV